MTQATLRGVLLDETVRCDYSVDMRPRYGHGKATHSYLHRILEVHEARYAAHLRSFLGYAECLKAIPAHETVRGEPFWWNDAMPPFDGVSIYGFLAERNPGMYLEIGSGYSTMFARRAIREQQLRTSIVSIDPEPRVGIDAICDTTIRARLEDCDLSLFDRLTDKDVLFCDGSHRAFQNSDATVFFTEVVPRLKPGVLVGVHDIFLPHDYPPEWVTRCYNEQYLLACYLLGGSVCRVELPAYYCCHVPHLNAVLDEVWNCPNLEGRSLVGGGFWWTMMSDGEAQ